SGLQETPVSASCHSPAEDLGYLSRHSLRHQRNDSISKLFICLRVRYDDRQVVRKPHQTRAFARSQTARRLSTSFRNKNFRSVFEVTSTQCARYALWIYEPESKAITFVAMPFCVILEIFPQPVAQRVFGMGIFIKDFTEFRRRPVRPLRKTEWRRFTENL